MNLAWLGHLYFGSVVLFWLSAMARTAKGRADQRFRVGAEDPGPEDPPSVAVVIPARNEEANIGPCLESVLAQDYPRKRVVVLDDGSTDRTPEILAGYAGRVSVLQGGGGPLPEGWLGKPWACQRAAEHTLTHDPPPDWILFIDADVRLAPRALSAALGYATRHDLAMLSGLGQMVTASFWEEVLQPMIGGLILAGNPLDKVNDPERRPSRPLANGQFILLRRDAWLAVGGHGAVRSDVVDDVGMATAVTRAGFAYHLVFMRSLFGCRMYDSFRSLWEGWTKNLFIGVDRSWARVLGIAGFLSSHMILPWVLFLAALLGLIEAPWSWWAAGTLLTMHTARAWLDRTFQQPLWTGLFMPLSAALTIGLFVSSGLRASKGTATWKGRTLPQGGGG